ncbi:MAG: hypothetical protein AAGL96_06510 [Pseudomonadota bacterium]
MKLLKALAIATILVTGRVEGQQTEGISPNAVWQHFKQVCTQVLFDTDNYLAGLRTPGVYGERVISVSPDRNAVSVYLRQGNAYDEVYLHIVGARQLRQCLVIGEFYELDHDTLSGLFEAAVLSQPGLIVTGGLVPQDYVDGGSKYEIEQFRVYAVDGLWPQAGLIASVQIVEGELQMAVEYLVDQ